ncbi:LysE family translocator [Bradyrhizobium sp. CCBAU 53421]|uniref:LysE family translocator n=1 Tax=Bradyrhizobium sp. CCBAU 53421 TaxID=1325120 RepID=UPI00188A29AE|nr:LysE family translocator [Bradyrhizobium sp. CCBAU 53421]QOZ33664.1 LysE family translocator [Bradyrhizobium sp. CCBAU 53421]
MGENSLFAFTLTVTLIELTPGPNMGYLAVLAASAGRRAGLAATAGVALGLLGIGIASSLGLAAIVAASDPIYEALRWGGALYLLWLAWQGWRDAPQEITKPFEATANTRFFLRGLITNLLNPKAGVFYLSIFPTFIDEARPLLLQTAILLTVYVTIATAVHTAVVISANAIRPSIEKRANTMLIRRIMSALLAVVAIWLFYTTRRTYS